MWQGSNVDEQERMRKKSVMALFKATILALAWTNKPPSTQNLSTNHYTSGSSNSCTFFTTQTKCTCAIPIQKYLTY